MKKILLLFILSTLFLYSPVHARIIAPLLDITVNKNAIGGDANFDFNFTSYYHDYFTGLDSVYDTGNFQIQTQDGQGSYTTSSFVGNGVNLFLTETPVQGWQNTEVVCTSGNSNISTSPVANGVKITALPYSSITCTFTNTKQSAKTPVLIVPGILGTDLIKGSEKLWLDLGRNFTDIGDRFMDPLQFNLNLTPSDTTLTLGDVVKKQIFLFDYTDGLLNEFQSQSYGEGTSATSTLFTFPYDWRYGVSGVFGDGKTNVDALKQKIADIRLQTGSDKVDVIAHSTGGLLVKKYVMENPSDNHIGKAVFVGVPNLGAPKAVKTLLQGDNFGIPFLADGEIKKLAANFPVAYDLLPSQSYFNQLGSFVRVISSDNLLQPIKDLNYGETRSFLLTDHGLNSTALGGAENLHTTAFDGYDPRTAGVDTYNIIGCKSGTFGKFYENRTTSTASTVNYLPQLASGDGTVPVGSAASIPADDAHTFYVLNQEHSKMLSADGSRQEIVNIIAGTQLATTSAVMAKADALRDPKTCALTGHWWQIFSPVAITVTDGAGHRAGIASDGSIQNDIPGADYEVFGDHKFVFVPDNGQTYTTNLSGTGTGTFTLKNETISDNQVVKTEIFSNIPVTASFIGSLGTGDITTLTAQATSESAPVVITPSATINAAQSQDVLAPISTSTISGVTSGGGLYRSDVVITLSVTDPIIVGQEDRTSGVLETKYNSDNVGYQTYDPLMPILVSAEGAHILKFFSTDKAGNNEPEQTLIFTIDKITPTIIIASPTAKDYLRSDKFVINVSSTDSGTGVAYFGLAIDGKPTKNGNSIDLFYEKLGSHSFTATSTDFADNVSATSTLFRITTTPESTISDIERAYSLGWIKDKKTKEILIREIKTMIKLTKIIDKIESRDKNGKKITRLIERIEKRIDKVLARALKVELRLYNKGKIINDKANEILQEDIQWLIDN